MKNRNIFPWTGTFVLLACFSAPISAQEVNLTPSTSTSQVVRVEAWLEGSGVVIPDQEKTMNLDLEARFQYDERVIARARSLKSIRQYHTANAKIKLGEHTSTNQLTKQNKIIINQTGSPGEPIKIASLRGPLSQNEFELLNVPANTLILSEIFERQNARPDDTWKPDSTVLAQFLNIDRVDDSTLEIELKSVKNNVANLVMSGKVTGSIDGAFTEIDVNGSVRFDVKRGLVTQSRFNLSQQRDMGLMAPGLEATFKLSTRLSNPDKTTQLTDQGLAALRQSAGKITDSLILEPASSAVSLMHVRDWRVIGDHSQRTIMRYLSKGKMLGQCDIIDLPKRLNNQPQSLEQFKLVVKEKLASYGVVITGGNQTQTNAGLNVLRVDATGKSKDVDLKWTYFTITNNDGRRVQLVFTSEPGAAQALSGPVNSLVQSLRFETPTTQNAGYRKPATGQ